MRSRLSTLIPNSWKRLVRRFAGNRRGSIAVFLAVATIPLIGFLGAATDAARGYMVKARLSQALDAAGGDVPRHETLPMVIGRGTSDPDANSNVSKLCRMLWEGMGFGWGETGYSGVTFPLTEPALEHAARLGYRRIVVFPYFLFTGVLVKRIYHYADRVAARHPEIEVIKAPYLNDHALVLDAFADRVGEILDGANAMNCLQCKYREQVLGFEDEVGLAQQSHHHHVEGVGTGDGHDHGHHHHDHGHHPYPQADHPLGPKSMKAEPG